MKLRVYLYGHPVLREVSTDITPDYPELKKLIDDMFETMYASEGVGLAAPQIGRNHRIIVIDADLAAEYSPECAGRKLVLINPTIEILDGDKVSRPEGCLSLPGISENVNRIEHIRLKWLDENFTPHEEEMRDYLARIVQHEYDHLEGHVFIDHISPIRKQLIRAKLNNIITGRVRCSYNTRTAKPHK